ncbi:MAG: CHAT domain-containing tetratricopeptide repeat protein [Tychonema bourrellyi B0820]|nr:CHAT domain-containing tetratricopeptide repeat protein [Tychonema bourrellyi B0820]
MNDQRTQAYLNLINQLLSCNKGDEPRILQENEELLDQGLREEMIVVAQQLEEAGKENEVRSLMSIARQLAQALGLLDNNPTESKSTPQDYVNFLMETLQKVSENDNPEVIYPFWAQNLDKLDENLIQVLDEWARNRISSVNTEEATSIAGVIVNISNLIQQFPLGDIGINKELAITGYKIALIIFTFECFPEYWAMTQNNLASVYSDRIRGNKADNLEIAITYYQEALKVYTFDAFPEDWAMIQNNLAVAYSDRIRGNKTKNLEQAISSYCKALKVYTFECFPEDWAMTQNNLAVAYNNRIRGNKADNLENAITYYQEALKIRTFDNFPVHWAETQNNLGTVYSERIRGDKADNLEMAITCYHNALKVRTFDAFPVHWAETQNNIAIAYRNRIRGDKAENSDQAITCYEEALKVYTFDAFPQDWAEMQNNLATAYCNRIRGDKADNLEMAITLYTEALKVRKFKAFPQDWAMTQNNLAAAYQQRIRGDKADNLEKAIASYSNALAIYTKENDPLNCLQTARNLANLHYSEKQWQPATKAYNLAIEAVENARLEALNPHSRQEVLSNAIGVFNRIVKAYLNLNQTEKALEYIERSKGRNLVELMTQKNLQPQGVSQEIIDKLNELKQRAVNEQIRLQHQSINQNLMRSDNLTPYVQDHSYLKEYQQELDIFIEREIKPIDPLFSLTQKVDPIPFTDIQALTDAETCLLQWYITGEKILAFVVSANGDIKVWQSSEDKRKQLFDAAIRNYLQLYYSETGKKEWINQLSSLIQTFADILHINDILALIPDTCKRLIIIPHWFLHILPLHALPISNSHVLKFGAGANAQDLHDLFPNGVQYAPSCQLLRIAQSFHHSDFHKLFAIQNPTKDLLYTDLEVNIVSNFFTDTESQIIAKDNATKNAIISHLKTSNNHCHHFSCHGEFKPNNPLESALLLANKEPLTLGEIFELRLNQCRLVTLSACETGLIDINSISDEYIGLPSGFLFAGSPSVVSSLWTVNDLSTSFLMIKFYEILFSVNLNISVAVALKEAQDWLQNLTIEKLDKFLEQYQPQIDKYLAPLRPGQRKIYQESLEKIRQRQPHPFANPYYWAGFIATGI